MTISAGQPRGTASGSLMTQVDVHNVLAVHAVLAAQADAMAVALRRAYWLRDIPQCAHDPVSVDAKAVFQPKIDGILDVDERHLDEVREAASRLREAALQYRYTETDIADALAPARKRLGLPGT